jgi:uncharacterized protein with NRDE domain
MCTLALYFQEFTNYPLIVAANRDEFFTRPSAPPEIMAYNPAILAGKDLLAGGTWLGVNEYGLVAGILNRRSDAERDASAVRSRGLLCLEVLKAKDPVHACSFLSRERGSSYRPFNLLIANAEAAYVGYNSEEKIHCSKLPKGLHVFSNTSVHESQPAKIENAHTLFERAKEQFLAGKDLHYWIAALKQVLSDHTSGKDFTNPKDAICVHTEAYGTVSSSLIFYEASERLFHMYYAPGPPCREDYGASLSIRING